MNCNIIGEFGFEVILLLIFQFDSVSLLLTIRHKREIEKLKINKSIASDIIPLMIVLAYPLIDLIVNINIFKMSLIIYYVSMFILFSASLLIIKYAKYKYLKNVDSKIFRKHIDFNLLIFNCIVGKYSHKIVLTIFVVVIIAGFLK